MRKSAARAAAPCGPALNRGSGCGEKGSFLYLNLFTARQAPGAQPRALLTGVLNTRWPQQLFHQKHKRNKQTACCPIEQPKERAGKEKGAQTADQNV